MGSIAALSQFPTGNFTPYGFCFAVGNIYIAGFDDGSGQTGLLIMNATTGAIAGTFGEPLNNNNSGMTAVFDGASIWVNGPVPSGVGDIFQFSTGGGVGAPIPATSPTANSSPVDVDIIAGNPWVACAQLIPTDNTFILQMNSGGVTGSIAVGVDGVGAGYRSMVEAGGDVWATNNGGDTLYQLTTGGSVINSFALPNPGNGIAFDGTSLWIASASTGNLMQYDLTGALISTTNIGGHPLGVVFDGTFVWTSDHQLQVVTVFDPTTLAVLAQGLPISATDLWQIAFDGTHVWVTTGQGTTVGNPGQVTELRYVPPTAPTGRVMGTFVGAGGGGQIGGTK